MFVYRTKYQILFNFIDDDYDFPVSRGQEQAKLTGPPRASSIVITKRCLSAGKTLPSESALEEVLSFGLSHNFQTSPSKEIIENSDEDIRKPMAVSLFISPEIECKASNSISSAQSPQTSLCSYHSKEADATLSDSESVAGGANDNDHESFSSLQSIHNENVQDHDAESDNQLEFEPSYAIADTDEEVITTELKQLDVEDVVKRSNPMQFGATRQKRVEDDGGIITDPDVSDWSENSDLDSKECGDRKRKRV